MVGPQNNSITVDPLNDQNHIGLTMMIESIVNSFEDATIWPNQLW